MRGVKIHDKEYCAACYFRTIAEYPNRKCLIQLTEKCNLCCKHCFVSARHVGEEMKYENIKKIIVPQLLQNSVTKVTLTGGEPFVYDKLKDVVQLLVSNDIAVSICTNATLITENFLDTFNNCDLLHFNVSLDGFSSLSHGKFRGNEDSKLFNTIIDNIRLLGKRGFLNGILTTPNVYSTINEYIELCKFAKKCGAKYVLMNPLSQFGRGEQTANLAFNVTQMEQLRQETAKFSDKDFEMVYIRFPNSKKMPLGECVAGKVLYIFTNGDIAYCPYMVFAARDIVSAYSEKDFILGNIFENEFNWDDSLKNYKLPIKADEICKNCSNDKCKKGCFAAKISHGNKLSDKDDELCPLSK